VVLEFPFSSCIDFLFLNIVINLAGLLCPILGDAEVQYNFVEASHEVNAEFNYYSRAFYCYHYESNMLDF
jgi:hypothetical protein